jgi:hypothetical protein
MNVNETAIRNAYQVAEGKDLAGWVKCFTEDGTFADESIGVTYRGKQFSRPVEIYAAAFPDIAVVVGVGFTRAYSPPPDFRARRPYIGPSIRHSSDRGR